MRRKMMADHDEGAGYWPSFADIMSVVVLVLLFVLVTVFVQAAFSIQQRVVGKQAVQDLMDNRAAVTQALQLQLGEEYVLVSSDGNIIFKGDVLFYPDKAVLRNTADVDQLLTRLAHSIGNVLDQERFRSNLDMIVVEGHTATDDKPAHTHWELSSDRARVIVLTLQAKDPRLADPKNARYLGAAARAHYQPRAEGTTEAEKSQNRRVEIRLVLRDEGLRDALLSALSQ